LYQYHSIIIGTTLSWKSIEYTVTIKEKDKEITKTLLHPMSGEARSGELLAVMGTSGSFKYLYNNNIFETT
jgi:ABC-type dipeptide/oligopeptide/nickel transport system ATPase subunit